MFSFNFSWDQMLPYEEPWGQLWKVKVTIKIQINISFTFNPFQPKDEYFVLIYKDNQPMPF